MRLPELSGFDATRDALHRSSQVLGTLRSAFIDPLPNSLHFSLDPTPAGATTGPMPGDWEVELDYGRGEIRVVSGAGEGIGLEISGLNQVSLAARLRAQLLELGQETESIDLKEHHPGLLLPNKRIGLDYALAMDRIRTALARFRGRLGGYLTPIVLWPHHFDLAFLWFPGEGRDEHRDAHLAFGLAPTGHGFPRPYVYAYAWPVPEGLTGTSLPSPARWYNDGWTGAVLDYDALATVEDPELVLEGSLYDIWETIAPRLPNL